MISASTSGKMFLGASKPIELKAAELLVPNATKLKSLEDTKLAELGAPNAIKLTNALDVGFNQLISLNL